MMNSIVYLTAVLILSLFVSGCSTVKSWSPSWTPWHSHKKDTSQPSTAKKAPQVNLLDKTAQSVAQEYKKANATQQAANPPKSVSAPPPPSSYAMNIPASVDWNGPIEPILKELAHKTNYQFRSLGHPPNMPIIVSIHTQKQSIGEIVRNLGLQCGNKAQVVVLPKRKIVELRYQRQG